MIILEQPQVVEFVWDERAETHSVPQGGKLGYQGFVLRPGNTEIKLAYVFYKHFPLN